MVTTLKVVGPPAFSKAKCPRNPGTVLMKSMLRRMAASNSSRAASGTEKLSMRKCRSGFFAMSMLTPGMPGLPSVEVWYVDRWDERGAERLHSLNRAKPRDRPTWAHEGPRAPSHRSSRRGQDDGPAQSQRPP